MATASSITSLKGQYWSDLDWKDIQQTFLKSLRLDSDLSAFVTRETARNGIKQFLTMGTATVGDLEKETKIDIFNPPEIDIKQQFIYFEFQKVVSIKVPIAQWQTSFTSQKEADTFKRMAIDTLYDTFKLYFWTKRMEILLKGKLEKTAADGSLATDNLVFDETVNVGSFVSEQEVKDGLNKMRKQMATYRTPSLQHTAFSKNAANKRHYANFDMSDFYLVWNDKLYTNISDLTSNLFNKEDILLKAGKTIHQQFELVGSPTNNEKTAYNKIVAFAVHKDALKEIVPGEMATEILKANFQTVTRFLVMYGHGRIGKFPIVKFITSN